MALITISATYDDVDTPIGVPFNATVFFLTLVMASSGITVLPSLRTGATLTSSQTIGTWNPRQWSHVRPGQICGLDNYFCGSVDGLNSLTNFWSDTYGRLSLEPKNSATEEMTPTVTWNESHSIIPLAKYQHIYGILDGVTQSQGDS